MESNKKEFLKVTEEQNTPNSIQTKEEAFFTSGEGVKDCRGTIEKYFHPVNIPLSRRFNILYDLFGINDRKLGLEIGIDKSTMNRYRRGVFYPTSQMKLLIAQGMSRLGNYQVDSSVIWGSDLFFENFREEQKKSVGVQSPHLTLKEKNEVGEDGK